MGRLLLPYEDRYSLEDGGGGPGRADSLVMRGDPGWKNILTLVRAYTNVDIIEPTRIAGQESFLITR